MNDRNNPIYELVGAAIDRGSALQARDIRALRARSKKAVTLLWGVFWAGIAIFNLALWCPLPIEINRTVLYVMAFAALAVGVVVPLVGLRKHQASLELLKVSKEQPKKKTASEAARVYIDQVKKQDRPFVNVEVELLGELSRPAEAKP